MAEAYSKPCQISKMMGDIENPDIVRTVYSVFPSIQAFSNIKPCSDILRGIKSSSGIIKAYWAIIRHIQNSV